MAPRRAPAWSGIARSPRPRPAPGRKAAIGFSYLVSLDDLSRDDHALHLVRAFADAKKRRIPVEPLDHELGRVAIAAMDAHRLVRVLERGFGGEVLGHAGLQVAALAAVVDLGRLPDEQARSLGARRHLAQLELNRLVLADRLAERVPLLRIPDCLVERRLGDADAPGRDVDPSEL